VSEQNDRPNESGSRSGSDAGHDNDHSKLNGKGGGSGWGSSEGTGNDLDRKTKVDGGGSSSRFSDAPVDRMPEGPKPSKETKITLPRESEVLKQFKALEAQLKKIMPKG
jgi:hypothetical protein